MTSGPYKSIIFSALFLYSIIFFNILCSPLQYLLCVIYMLLCMLLAGMYKAQMFFTILSVCALSIPVILNVIMPVILYNNACNL